MSDWNLGLDPTPGIGTDPNEATNRINFHDHSGVGKGEPIDSQYIINTPAGNITATNTQAAIAELNVLANMGRVHVPVRQTVLYGYTNGVGQAAFLQQGSGLSVNLLAASTPVIIAFAYNFNPMFGQLDFIGSVTEDIPSAWSALPPNQTCYLYVDRDITTGVLTYGYSLFAPAYQNLAPETPLTDQHWFDLNSFYMKRYSGTEWENKQRVFVGECTTDASSVTSVVCYAIQGKFTSTAQSWENETAYTLHHNTGLYPEDYKITFTCIAADNGYSPGDRIIFGTDQSDEEDATRGLATCLTRNTAFIRTGSFVMLFKKDGSAYDGYTPANWRMGIITKRGF